MHSQSDFDLVLLFLAAVFMPAVSALAGAQLAKRTTASLLPRYWQTMVRGWLVAVLVLLTWRWLGRPLAQLGLDVPVGVRGAMGLVAVGAAALVAAVQLLRLKSLTPEQMERAKKAIAGVKITPNTRAELAVFVLVALSAGVWEELLYRGFLIWFLVPLTGAPGAIILSSLVFGLGHIYQGRRGILFTSLIGLLFAAAFVFTKSLWWLMVAHALIDIYGGSVAFRVKKLMARAS
ncbi:MAG: CPBP family intramembrane metalloprotease [Pseudomonadota bacterium]|nr:CPBP family intramembrane metalloprotease [Pseudomonadota bacterium]